MSVDVFLYVQHLLGIGHLRRASLLAKALDKKGLKVIFVTGGRPVPDLDMGDIKVLQLPPLHAADDSFKVLIDIDNQVVDDSWKDGRKELLLQAFKSSNPKILLLEMFPFGRRQMRFELDPLIELAKKQQVPVITSVRDILTTHKTPGKGEWIIDRVQKDIDHVLVHGVQSFIPLEGSFPLAKHITDKISYTGYVVETTTSENEKQHSPDRHGVLVSAGGGAVALPLAEAVIQAKEISKLKDVPWRLLLGNNLPEEDFRVIEKRAPKGLTVERNRPDFQSLLQASQLSISQAGYNTILEILTTSTPAIVVPFASDTQSEQTTRAEKLESLGVLKVISEKDLCPQILAQAVDGSLMNTVNKINLDMDGAENSATIIKNLIKKKNTHG
ncbi:glycosyltransferase family protein [Kiloniella sp.]|uniref:glycosyltransferase family protein n=1 Tax=Kiloniella sp. TaxID=1938587 RepID=UPI003B020C4D